MISGILSACGDSTNNLNSAKHKLQIISTIKPIQAIVLAIAGEHAQSEQLIPDYASPHNYSFKPSDIRKVKNADVVFRIDEHMESQLNAVFESLENSAKLISLAEVKGMKLLQSNDSHPDHKENNDAHEINENIDFHIWTSPKNAEIIAKVIADSLSKLDSKNEVFYQQNLKKFTESLKIESEKIRLLLTKHQDQEYIVFHNSWQYFANDFGLQKPFIVDLHEGISSGAKTVGKIRTQIEKDNIHCVFYDSSISKERLKLLTNNINTSQIDVLAKKIETKQDTYIRWLSQLATQVDTCLSR